MSSLARDLAAYRRDPAAFCDRFITKNEKNQPWRLSDYQRRVLALAFKWDVSGRLLIRVLLWSEPKKSGKTFLAALLLLWWGFTNALTEIIVCANDLEQSQGRVFKTAADLCRHNPELGRSATVRASEIELSNGTMITAIASDYRGAAGSRHSLVVFDEIWGFDSERAQRLYEELTPPPTEPSAWILIVSYAGIEGESKLLETLYRRGLAGERIDDALEVYRADEQVTFWSHTPRQAWQTEAYYAEQRRSLRPATYQRLHENRWVSGACTFITPELWDPCIDPEMRPLLANPELSVYSGIDAALKHDIAARVTVAWDGDTKFRLVSHRLWKPTGAQPLDLESTLEADVRAVHQAFDAREFVADPWQMARSVATLKAAGIRIRELPQTVPTTTAMGQALLDALNSRALRMYPSEELRAQAFNTVAIETTRGWRIAKERASRKIDGIVALAMAVLAATEAGPRAYQEFRLLNADPIVEVGETVAEFQARMDGEEEQRRKESADELRAALVRGAGFYFPGD